MTPLTNLTWPSWPSWALEHLDHLDNLGNLNHSVFLVNPDHLDADHLSKTACCKKIIQNDNLQIWRKNCLKRQFANLEKKLSETTICKMIDPQWQITEKLSRWTIFREIQLEQPFVKKKQFTMTICKRKLIRSMICKKIVQNDNLPTSCLEW